MEQCTIIYGTGEQCDSISDQENQCQCTGGHYGDHAAIVIESHKSLFRTKYTERRETWEHLNPPQSDVPVHAVRVN